MSEVLLLYALCVSGLNLPVVQVEVLVPILGVDGVGRVSQPLVGQGVDTQHRGLAGPQLSAKQKLCSRC